MTIEDQIRSAKHSVRTLHTTRFGSLVNCLGRPLIVHLTERSRRDDLDQAVILAASSDSLHDIVRGVGKLKIEEQLTT